MRWDLIGKAFCDCRSQKDFRETTSQKILKHREKPGLEPTTTQKASKTQQPAQLCAPGQLGFQSRDGGPALQKGSRESWASSSLPRNGPTLKTAFKVHITDCYRVEFTGSEAKWHFPCNILCKSSSISRVIQVLSSHIDFLLSGKPGGKTHRVAEVWKGQFPR